MEKNNLFFQDLLPVLTTGSIGVWECNPASGLINFKNNFFTILGLTNINLEFSTLDELRAHICKDDLQPFNNAITEAIKGINTTLTYRCFNSEGTEVQLESTFMFQCKNILAFTVNKGKMLQMMTWEKQYHTLVNTLFPHFIFVFDENFFYIDVIIPDGLRLFHTREQLIGQDARQFYPPEVSELLSTNIKECIKTNKWKEVEHHIILNDTSYYYQARIVPVDGNKAFCLIQDIGDRVRRMDELITQRQRAEESDRLKSVFLANMSHEIRTPLNAIVGFSDYMMNDDDPENRQRYMEIIDNSTTALLNIIDDILDLSRLEAGMSELHFEKTDIIAMMMAVIKDFSPKMNQGIELLTEIPDGSIVVPTDVNRIKQVLNNLLSNAVKNTQKGSITLKVEEKDEKLIFSVADTGNGIPEDKLDVIFDRFEKLDKFMQGAGLGLSICKSIADKLGGNISVTSKIGEGSVFSLTIPYRHTGQKEDIGSMRELYGNKRKKVMIANTIEEEMLYICEILSKKYDTIQIYDIDKIISAFILDQPNLVLISMEIASKKEIISKIRAISPSLPIIAMTTSDFYYDQRLAIDNGCTDVIARPFSPFKLEEIVMALIV